MELLELVQQAQAGQQAALEEICRRFTGLVKQQARQPHLLLLREDAEAEGWLAVVQAVRTYDTQAGVPVAGYIASCVRYAVWNLFKREKRRWQHEVSLAGGDNEEDANGSGGWLAVLAGPEDVAAAVESKVLVEQIRLLLADLSPGQQRAVAGTLLEGKGLAAVGRETGISAQAVFNVRKRVLAKLFKNLHLQNVSE